MFDRTAPVERNPGEDTVYCPLCRDTDLAKLAGVHYRSPDVRIDCYQSLVGQLGQVPSNFFSRSKDTLPPDMIQTTLCPSLSTSAPDSSAATGAAPDGSAKM